MASATLWTESTAACRRYNSGIESYHHQSYIIAGMTIRQCKELSDRPYAVTTAIRDFFQEVNRIRNQDEGENYHES